MRGERWGHQEEWGPQARNRGEAGIPCGSLKRSPWDKVIGSEASPSRSKGHSPRWLEKQGSSGTHGAPDSSAGGLLRSHTRVTSLRAGESAQVGTSVTQKAMSCPRLEIVSKVKMSMESWGCQLEPRESQDFSGPWNLGSGRDSALGCPCMEQGNICRAHIPISAI